MPVLRIVCLANSRKYQGRCVAGLRADGKGWVRPIGHGNDGALTRQEIQLQDGSEPQPLDLIEIEVAEPRPEPNQPENWLIGRRRWRLVDRPAPDGVRPALRKYVVRGPDLFGDRADRLPFASFAETPAPASLALVVPTAFHWHIKENGGTGRWQARACFELGDTTYDLGMTDPILERRLCTLPEGAHPASAAGFADDDRLLLTISLGEPFYDHCYKLVASVIALPRSWWR